MREYAMAIGIRMDTTNNEADQTLVEVQPGLLIGLKIDLLTDVQ